MRRAKWIAAAGILVIGVSAVLWAASGQMTSACSDPAWGEAACGGHMASAQAASACPHAAAAKSGQGAMNHDMHVAMMNSKAMSALNDLDARTQPTPGLLHGKASHPLGLSDLDAKTLPALADSIDKALAAVKAEKDAEAVKELITAQKTLTAIRKAVALHVQPKVVNTVCPIMGGKVNTDNLKPELTRTFDGKTVGFCCGGCPDMWDKLSDEQKNNRLAKLEQKSDAQ